MAIRHLGTFLLAFGLLTGCGTKNHLNRDAGLYEPLGVQSADGSNAYADRSASFDGKLNLLYDKKIKGSADSPLLVWDRFIAFKTTRQRFLVFDQESGEKVCQIKRRRGIILHPALADSFLVLVRESALGQIQVINLFSGKVIQERVINEIRSGPIIVHNSVIFGTTQGLTALSLPGLDKLWSIRAEGAINTPAVSDGVRLYYAEGSGVVKALNARNGDVVWEMDTGSSIVSPLSLGQYLYFGTADGKLMVRDRESGDTIWEHAFGHEIHGGVAARGDFVYTGCTDGNVYCLSARDGSTVWKAATGGVVTAAPILYGNTVLVGSHDRHFYSIDGATGEILDRRRLDGTVTQAAAVGGGRIFVACRNNRLYSFEGD